MLCKVVLLIKTLVTKMAVENLTFYSMIASNMFINFNDIIECSSTDSTDNLLVLMVVLNVFNLVACVEKHFVTQ